MCLFFVSSRRRHTRWPRDWSSDVCSSDLERADKELQRQRGEELDRVEARFELTKNPLRKLISIRQSQLVGMIEFRRLIRTQIGRASCRERVWGSGGAGSLEGEGGGGRGEG